VKALRDDPERFLATVGYVNVKDILTRAAGDISFTVKDALRPAYFVGESLRAVALLDAMKKRRTQIVIVVDELGATSGIVTLEDLVEELVETSSANTKRSNQSSCGASPTGR